MAYYGFFSLFPLLLVLVTVLGLVLHGDMSLQHRIEDSSLAQFPIIGTQIRNNIHSLNGGVLPLAIGLAGALWGGLAFTKATQIAQDRLWAVPQQHRHSFLRSKLRGLMLLSVLGGSTW